jgi:hypothetical protein
VRIKKELWLGKDSLTNKPLSGGFSRARLAVLQSKTSLRLSNPHASQAVGLLLNISNMIGWGRIRTFEGRSPLVLQTSAFDRSATQPKKRIGENM